jgi:hypothetical protein
LASIITTPVTNVAGIFICAMSTGFICTAKAHTWVQCTGGARNPDLATVLFLRITIFLIINR